MTSLPFVTVDVFTTTRFAGNPLAIVKIPKGRDVATAQMQSIASEFNLSETVFLYENNTNDETEPEWRIRIFMVGAELPFAGHPTIGTACYALGTLANNSRHGKLHCNAGPIELEYDGEVAKASIPHNVHIHTEHEVTAEQIYHLQPAIAKSPPPQSVDLVSPVKGMNFVCVELPSLEILAQVEASGKAITPQLDVDWNTGFIGSYFYVIDEQEGEKLTIRTRMIEKSLEDPATGAAASGLAALLALKHKLRFAKFSITQGVEMGRRSEIGVEVTLTESLDKVKKVVLSGSALKVMEGTVFCD
ncbi:hypothetical protein LTR62_001218 [Meristemomyces frigidus]|uniref:Diaminopimelate epimerase-like protein n=1 Tax=Meristemomyces frigidus TaxID=1508187 RepID=A0AAN7YLW3_9PEZI|nr:hypothetical protein LTR62_001218 [Meristemomyces frigidus]